MTTEAWTGTYESLPLGAAESCSQVIDGAAIDAFAQAIQSFNPLHMDGDWARANTERINAARMRFDAATRP